MKTRYVAAALIAGATLISGVAQAQDSPFMVRARALSMSWDNSNHDGLDQAGVGKVEGDLKWIPEVDISYFLSKNVAAELVLTYPQTVDVKASKLGKIGEVKALPPSLLIQYHFTDLGAFKPYIGAGVNLTIFTKKDFDTALGNISVDRTSTGLVGQLGFDYLINRNWSINVDFKYVTMDTDVKLKGTKIGNLGLSPTILGVGVGYRF